MNREQHLEWAKSRANALLDKGDIRGAAASMIGDLDRHPELKDHRATSHLMTMMLAGQLTSVDETRKFINGFN
jgi:hypothetical protein